MSRRRPRPPQGPKVPKPAFKPPRDPNKPALNHYHVYKCPACMGMWLGVELDQGTIPMFSPCFALQGCRGTATMVGERVGAPPNLPLLIEWYEPSTYSGLSYEMKNHVRDGGLVRRATRNAPDWVKQIA